MNLPPSLDPPAAHSPDDEGLQRLLKRLGLPLDYNYKCHAQYIPTHSDLQRAAVYALEEWTAFLVLHHDTPSIIAEHLIDLAEVIMAACAIDGDHRARAVRVGLELEPRYWWKRNKADDMPGMIMMMLSTALDLGDQRLLSRVYRMWSVYLYLNSKQFGSKKALDMALEYAEASGRDDLALLAEVERFNLEIAEMVLAEAELKANMLLAETRRLNYTYAQGRVYLSLARACHYAALPYKTFMYSQQALVIFALARQPDMAGQAIDEMLGSLQQQDDHSPVYISRLFAFLETLMESSVNPWFQAAMYHHQAVHNHIQKYYDQARIYALKAWLHYREIGQKESCMSVVHMLGLIQTKRQRWFIAARHLTAAANFYQKISNPVITVQVNHALAYVPFEQGDFGRARAQLGHVLSMAQALPESAARDRLVQLIRDDLNEVPVSAR